MVDHEKQRLEESKNLIPWKKFGPYVSERQWGTVREDYSESGSAWDFFPHDHARSRVYRWGEDGIAGISDDKQLLCFSLAFWNGKDPILKERLFGLNAKQGNHSEDVKELYYHLDNTPTHSYMKYLYKYPHGEFPYNQLIEVNHTRNVLEEEFEIIDTEAFNNNKYFDIFIEYAKADPEDILIKIIAINRSSESADLHIIPTIWFRNDWSWNGSSEKPSLKLEQNKINISHPQLGLYTLHLENQGEPMFTNNETNTSKIFGIPNHEPYVKDAFHEHIINGNKQAINPESTGTKAAINYLTHINPGGSHTIRLRLTKASIPITNPFDDFDKLFFQRIDQTDTFYAEIQSGLKDEELKKIHRMALSGMLWNKQFYYYNIKQWLNGDPNQFPPPPVRKLGRNNTWMHIENENILSMPDKWEYPWYAAWDSAFHCIALCHVDPDFAKSQLKIFLENDYMNPFGQIPAYEWAFGDVNPPVHAYGTWKVYQINKNIHNSGKGDIHFLETVYLKLAKNYSWWLNTKSILGKFIFGGGFLGLDNVSFFDRGLTLPEGQWLEQIDGSCWMAMYSLNMMRITLELASLNPAYEEEAAYYAQNFLRISAAINHPQSGLWNEEAGIFNDVLCYKDGNRKPLPVRSLLTYMPLFPVEALPNELINQHKNFKNIMDKFVSTRMHFAPYLKTNEKGDWIFSLLSNVQLNSIMNNILDENEFLSPNGVRSLSKWYKFNPFQIELNGQKYNLKYRPAEADTPTFGENSNWRGPVWFPINYLIIDSLLKHHHLFDNGLAMINFNKIVDLRSAALDLIERLYKIFYKNNVMPVYTDLSKRSKVALNEHILFYEYFSGENGSGYGASHQTGWTGLVADLIYTSSILKKDDNPFFN